MTTLTGPQQAAPQCHQACFPSSRFGSKHNLHPSTAPSPDRDWPDPPPPSPKLILEAPRRTRSGLEGRTGVCAAERRRGSQGPCPCGTRRVSSSDWVGARRERAAAGASRLRRKRRRKRSGRRRRRGRRGRRRRRGGEAAAAVPGSARPRVCGASGGLSRRTRGTRAAAAELRDPGGSGESSASRRRPGEGPRARLPPRLPAAAGGASPRPSRCPAWWGRPDRLGGKRPLRLGTRDLGWEYVRVARGSGHLLANAGDARGREGRSGATPREAAQRRHPGVGARGGESCALRVLSPRASCPTDHSC